MIDCLAGTIDQVVAAKLAVRSRNQPALARRVDVAQNLELGATVVIPWGIDEVRGTVAEVYGPDDDRRVVVALSPELSSYVVDELTTVTLPADSVRLAVVAA